MMSSSRRGKNLLVVAVCFTALIVDGYDLIVFGTTVPSLLAYHEWDVSEAELGVIGSVAMIGMLLGALLSGAVTDLIGRKRMLLACVASFSAFMGICAISPGPELFAVCRFLSGLGLGGVLPTAIALTVEFAPPRWRNFSNALMSSGYSVGAIIASTLAIVLLEPAGFRVMYAIGLAPLLLVVPIAWRWLPESPAYLAAKGKTAEAAEIAARFGVGIEVDAQQRPIHRGPSRLRGLFDRSNSRRLLVYATACFVVQLLTYGLNTWLPQIMRTAGYPLGSSLQFLVVLSIGAIFGTLVLAACADRIGGRALVITGFSIAVVALLLLSIGPSTAVLFLAVALAGVGANGTGMVLNSYTATRFDPKVRGSALGTVIGVGKIGAVVGPLVGGWILAAQLSVAWSFYAFLIPAVLGVVAMLFDHRGVRDSGQVHGSLAAKESKT